MNSIQRVYYTLDDWPFIPYNKKAEATIRDAPRVSPTPKVTKGRGGKILLDFTWKPKSKINSCVKLRNYCSCDVI